MGADPHQFNEDSYPAFHSNADQDLDPACHQSEGESAITGMLSLHASILSLIASV
jgi:hypothetical protein